jgi:hypothetical protein
MLDELRKLAAFADEAGFDVFATTEHQHHSERVDASREKSVTEGSQFVTLRSGERVPALGQGTWHMGENRRRAAEEAAAVRLGIELGMTLIDTAEMYGSGGAEEVVARAANGLRDSLFTVSKVYPHNASLHLRLPPGNGHEPASLLPAAVA